MPPLDLAAGQVYNFNPFASGSSVMGNKIGGSPFANVVSQNPTLGGGYASASAPASGSGSFFTGGTDTAGPGNPNAGQPGNAGTGISKSIADAVFGLGAGMIAPGFGIAKTGVQALVDPNFDLVSNLSFGILGNTPSGFPGAITNPGTIADMQTNPAAFGLSNAAVATTGQMTQQESIAQQAAQQAALDAAAGAAPGGASGFGPGGAVGANPGGTPGLGTGDAPGGAPGGVSSGGSDLGTGGASPGGAAAGTGGSFGSGGASGDYAMGGVVQGRGGTDSVPIWATPGEGVLTPGAVALLGPGLIAQLNRLGG